MIRTLIWSMAAFFAFGSLLCIAAVTTLVLFLRRQWREERWEVNPVRPFRQRR